jgi:tetratricopeptide (TPR) repeat protein
MTGMPTVKENRTAEKIYVRVTPRSYLAAGFFLLFFSAFLFYLEYSLSGFVLFTATLIVLPYLAYTDRIWFDGRRLRRTGAIQSLAARLIGFGEHIRINHIEQVDTQAMRVFKRSGRIVYAYRTTVRGRGVSLTFATGGERYIRLVRSLFAKLPDDVLDQRSMDLRDHYSDRRKVLADAKRSNIPGADVLEGSFRNVRSARQENELDNETASDEQMDRAEELHKLGNRLRVTGALLQALEAFRRATLIKPHDGWLLFEFAKCLYSFAGSEKDSKLERRALAMMRLAEKRAGNDGELLSRLGESYFQVGDWRRASQVFRRTAENVGESFRSLRGLAELSLREGKIAHVIHNFAAANRLTTSPALKRWSKGEVDYFSRLNEDDEYMELEVSRVNLVDSLAAWRSTALRVTAFGLPLIGSGILFQEEIVANLGWALSGIAIIAWATLSVLEKMLNGRIPLDMVERGE